MIEKFHKTEVVKNVILQSIEVKKSILSNPVLIEKIILVADECVQSIRNGGKILFCGNGGSFADAQHLSAELTSRFLFDRPGLPSLVLGANSSAATAIGNDYGYEYVFAREIEAIAHPTDYIIGITTSGNSNNILRAIEAANVRKVPMVVLTGNTGGKLPKTTKTIDVASTDTARIQECHILIGHIICEIIEAKLFSKVTNNSLT